MEEEQKKFEKYKIAIQLMDIELKMQWTIFTAFFIAHSLFLTFLFKYSFDLSFNYNNWLSITFISFLGIALVFYWATTYERIATYFQLRIEQALMLEKELTNEPSTFKLLQEGKLVSDNQEVIVNEQKIKMNWFGVVKTWNACRALMIIVALLYLIILIKNIPIYCCCCYYLH